MRMEQVWKDYLIARTDLRKLVLRAVQKSRLAFQDRKMQVKIEMESCFVSTDEKWALFIPGPDFLELYQIQQG